MMKKSVKSAKKSKTMGYNVVKYCGFCKTRMLFAKGEPVSHYCKKCVIKFKMHQRT